MFVLKVYLGFLFSVSWFSFFFCFVFVYFSDFYLLVQCGTRRVLGIQILLVVSVLCSIKYAIQASTLYATWHDVLVFPVPLYRYSFDRHYTDIRRPTKQKNKRVLIFCFSILLSKRSNTKTREDATERWVSSECLGTGMGMDMGGHRWGWECLCDGHCECCGWCEHFSWRDFHFSFTGK